MTPCALTLPLCFVGVPDWRIIEWIVAHRWDFVVWGIRWVGFSLVFGAAFSWFMLKYGHYRNWREEDEEQAKYLDDWTKNKRRK